MTTDELLRAAYRLAEKSLEAEARAELKRLFPDQSDSDVEDAFRRAQQLHGNAYSVGQKHWRKELTDQEEMLRLLQARCPDMPADLYAQALRSGLHASMW